jgi:dTDP-glucose pyrophosphorylase
MSENLVIKTFLPENSTLADAISNLDASHLRIVLVVSEEKVLLGSISDGDIRRGLLRGLDLKSNISSIINRNPLIVPPEMNKDMALQIMQANKILQLPIVDKGKRVVGLHLWGDVSASPERSNVMVIMAGGIGKRLRPHTENCPKPLLPVRGKPMLEHIIEHARLEGFNRFLLAVHYLGQMIEDHFGKGDRLGVKIDYLREQSPLGTAGALGLLNPSPNEPFVVTNGDVITDIRYGELLDFHIRHKASATMAVRVHEWQHPFGVVQTQGAEIVGFEEKPVIRSHINAGVYALNPDALTSLAAGEHCDMPTLFERLQEKAKLTVAYPMYEPWVDVGSLEDLKVANDKGGI